MGSDIEDDFEARLRDVNVGRSRSRSGSENLLRGDNLFGSTASRGDAFETPQNPSRSRSHTPSGPSRAGRSLFTTLGKAERVAAEATREEAAVATNTPVTVGPRFSSSPISAVAEIETQTARLRQEREDRERRTRLLVEQQE